MVITPEVVVLIVQSIEAVIKAAPELVKVAEAAKTWIAAMFQTGLIDVQTQYMLFAHVDALVLAALNGEPPPAWAVEPDPA